MRSENLFPIDKGFASFHSGIALDDVPVGVACCKECQHHFVQPVPEEAFLKAFYSSYMSKAKGGFYRESYQAEIPESFCFHYGRWLKRIGNMARRKNPSLLDVGCGLGMFLRLAQEFGFEVTGIEPNGEAAGRLNERYGIPVHNCLLEDVNISAQYDVITMWDLLEHLPDPKSAIRKVRGLLKSSGLLVLEIPVRDSLIHWLAKNIYRVSLCRIKRPLFLVYGIHHLQYFSEQSLRGFLDESGFEVIDAVRSETDISKLLRTAGSVSFVKTKAYNFVIMMSFLLARIFRAQNKLVMFAERRDKKDTN